MPIPLTLLQIYNTAADELGLNRTSVVANSTDIQVRRLFALINRDLREQVKDKDWTVLQAEYDLHVAQPITTTCDTILNSYQLTNIPDTSALLPGIFVCNADNIPVAARVKSVDTPTQVTLSEPATASAPQVSCVFAQDTYPEPPGFDRFINQTWWDRTNRWSLLGPMSPQIDQWHRSGVVTIGPRRFWRQVPAFSGIDFAADFGADFSADFNTAFNTGLAAFNYRLWPPPSALDTPINIVFEYITNLSVVGTSGGNAGVAQTTFLNDSDICLLDSDMLVLGAKWRMWQIQGFDYLPMQQEYLDYVARLYANDGGAKTLNMAQRRWQYLITSSNVQDANWPGPSGTNTA